MAYFLCLWCLTVNVLVWIQFVFGAIEDPSVLVEDDCTPGDDSTCPDGFCCVKEVSKTAFDFIHTFFPLETVLTKLVLSFVRSFVRSFIHKKPIAHTFQYNIWPTLRTIKLSTVGHFFNCTSNQTFVYRFSLQGIAYIPEATGPKPSYRIACLEYRQLDEFCYAKNNTDLCPCAPSLTCNPTSTGGAFGHCA